MWDPTDEQVVVFPLAADLFIFGSCPDARQDISMFGSGPALRLLAFSLLAPSTLLDNVEGNLQ